jgi:hypothetical protein
VIDFDIASSHHARALLVQGQHGFVVAMHPQRNILEVQQHVYDVFLQSFQRRVLVQHVVNFDLSDCRAGNRRKQHAP